MNFYYNNLRIQFEYLREAQLQLDKCVNNLTNLMEQAAHLFSDDADVSSLVAEQEPSVPDEFSPLPSDEEFRQGTHEVFAGTNQIEFNPLPPPVLEVDTSPTSPPWPMPASNVPFMAPSEGVEEVFVAPVSVTYEGTVNQPSFGNISYE